MTDSVRELTRDECLELLREGRIGRVSVTDQALPVIVPVNYVLDHDVVFRTRTGGLLDRSCRGQVVAFEIDDLAADGTSGWSVLVVGVADVIGDGERVRAMSSRLVSALDATTDLFMRISLTQVSGRRNGASAVAVGCAARSQA
jgi:nitroimidazol reductase NimA-like FMN-containing flavoprotein (pyridoxamine 5'-phosphate oxidase superfamily)